MPTHAKPFKSSLLQLRFEGPNLTRHAVPIYELGVSLIALQRMIHKARMVDTRQENKRAFLSYTERMELAMQLAGRKKASDGYGLEPFLTNPTTAAVLGTYVGWIMIALSKYAMRKIGRQREAAADKEHVFSVFIFNQLLELGGRIDNIGGIKSIQIASTLPGFRKPVTIDSEFKDYVNGLKDDVAYGPLRELIGRVAELVPAEDAVKITQEPKGIIKVLLSAGQFNEIRYSGVKNPLIRLTGEPMYRLGVETYHPEAFSAHTLEIINEESDQPRLPLS